MRQLIPNVVAMLFIYHQLGFHSIQHFQYVFIHHAIRNIKEIAHLTFSITVKINVYIWFIYKSLTWKSRAFLTHINSELPLISVCQSLSLCLCCILPVTPLVKKREAFIHADGPNNIWYSALPSSCLAQGNWRPTIPRPKPWVEGLGECLVESV